MTPRQLVIVGPPQSRRVAACQATLQWLGWPAARVVPVLDLLQGRAHLAEAVRAGDIVRWESPGECLATEQALLRLGARTPGMEAGFETQTDATALDLAGGELMPSAQWFHGFRSFWTLAAQQLREAPPHLRTHHLPDVLAFFDKRVTAQRWRQAGVPVPTPLTLSPGAGFEALREGMRAQGLRRVFVKLAHGSSGSGVVALELAGARMRAITTVEQVAGPGGAIRLYNTRRLRTLLKEADVTSLIDTLLRRHPVQVEAWIPKARHQGRVFDLRIVVIDGRAQHTLVRESRHLVTNLHLRNQRGDLDQVRRHLGEAAWQRAREVAEQGLRAFPGSLYAGVDVLVDAPDRQALLLEANAFGDYHRGVEVDGHDTYGAILRALLSRPEHRA